MRNFRGLRVEVEDWRERASEAKVWWRETARGVMGMEGRVREPKEGVEGGLEEEEEGGARGVSIRSLRNWSLFILVVGVMSGLVLSEGDVGRCGQMRIC